MIGPALQMLSENRCGGCGRSDLRLFNVDTSKLIDYAILFRVCVYCRKMLTTQAGRNLAMERWTWFVINANSAATTRARQAAVRELSKKLQEERRQEAMQNAAQGMEEEVDQSA